MMAIESLDLIPRSPGITSSSSSSSFFNCVLLSDSRTTCCEEKDQRDYRALPKKKPVGTLSNDYLLSFLLPPSI